MMDCARPRFLHSLVMATIMGVAFSFPVQADGPRDHDRRFAQFLDRTPATVALGAALHRPGDAVVTGFSGVRVQPMTSGDKILIDLDGPALRVLDLSNSGGPAQAQVLPFLRPVTVTARQIGQVFAVALDDATPPNVYAAATSAYGLPIVAREPDADGAPRRLRRGEPGARFMSGLFGPQSAGAGPGSIWRIDGRNGAVSLFATIPNSGAGLGDIVHDAVRRQFFVSDRASGLIYRIGPDGALRDTFDHGSTGRSFVGLEPVPDRRENRLDIQSTEFESDNPRSWRFPPPARRTYALGIFRNRLFYALADGPQVWSVALTPEGGFGDGVAWELSAPPNQAEVEITAIAFDESGLLYLAERGAPTGAYDFKALTAQGTARVLRYRQRQPDDPPGLGRWAPVPDEYAVGLMPEHRRTNGGLAIGYAYSDRGTFGRCGGTLWTTGEQLRTASDPARARIFAASGPLALHGLQGAPIDVVRPFNAPPWATLFARYDDRVPEAAAWEQFGHMGDVAIWQSCGAPPPRVVFSCPVGFHWNGFTQLCEAPATAAVGCPPEQHWDGRRCQPTVCWGSQLFDGRRCVCPPGSVWAGSRCVPPVHECPEGLIWDGQRCAPPPGGVCRKGLVWDGRRCVPPPPPCPPGQDTRGGTCNCPPGHYWDGRSCQGLNGMGKVPPPGAGSGDCPRGQIKRGDLCMVVDPAPEPPADQPPGGPPTGDQPPPSDTPPGDKQPPGGGWSPPPTADLTRPGIGIVPPAPVCLSIGGNKFTCSHRPAGSACPGGTDYESAPPTTSQPMCCRIDTTGACGPQREPPPPQCAPDRETRADRCWRMHFPNLAGVALCNSGYNSVICYVNSDCGAGACCDGSGVCVSASKPQATSVPPPPSGEACAAPMIRLGAACVCPEGQVKQGERCVPACAGGRVWGGEFCVCLNNQAWNGRACVPQGERRPTCRKGTQWDGERCAPVRTQPKCKRGETWDGRRCRPASRQPREPQGRPQALPDPVPGLSIGIGIGIGGGGGGRGPRQPGRVMPPPRGGPN